MKKQLTDKEKKHFEYLVKCISSAVNGFETPIPDCELNFKYLIMLSKQCSVEAMFAAVVLDAKDKLNLSDEIVEELKQIQAKQLLLDGMTDYEIEKVLSAFEEYKVKNAPLKGYFLKKEYPRSDFRSASDFDILFDVNEIDKVTAAFDSLGYKFDHYDDTQYHFTKQPYMYIEMHSMLVHKYEKSYNFFINQLDRSEKREGYKYSRKLSVDDHYLYMLVHHSNHFRIGGMGIRMLLDIYLYNKHHRANLNVDYINEKLRSFGIDKFEKLICKTADLWFDNPNPQFTYDKLETYILLSCTLGRVDTAVLISSHKSSVDKQQSKLAKISYLMSSVFPNRSAYEYTYPYAYKHRALIPVAWFNMWFKRLFIEKNVHFKRGLKNRLSYNDEDVKYVAELFNYLGLDDFKE